MIGIVQGSNLAVRFLLELCALAIYGYWGFQAGGAWWTKSALGIGAPAAAMALWGMFGSPKAAFPVSPALHLLLELFVFGMPAVLLFALGKPGWGWTYGAIAVANRLLMALWAQ